MTADGTIFLVDDDSQLRKAMVQTLELDGLPVTSFSRAEQALAALSEDFDGVVITDVRMPGMDGLEATRRIRARELSEGMPRTPIIAATAHVLEEDRQRCLDAGMDDVITKPVQQKKLHETLSAWLSHAGRQPLRRTA